MGRAKDPELIKRTLDFILSGEVKSQDLYLPAAGLRSHREGTEALFTWMKANWTEIAKRLGGNPSILSSVVTICSSSFTKEQQLAEVEAFFKTVDTKSFDQSLAQSKDAVRSKIAWVARDATDVADWVKENGYQAKL